MLRKRISKSMAIALGTALAIMACLALVACGGGSSSSSSASASASAADYNLATEGTLTVGTSADYKPMEYMDGDQIVGFDPAMMTEVANRLGLKVEFKNQAFDTLVTAIAGGKSGLDCAASSITINDERAEQIDFTDSYYDSNQAIVVMADSKLADKAALNEAGVKIGAQSGTSGEEWVKENCKKASYKPYQETPDLLAALRTGDLDAVVYDDPVAEGHVAGEYKDCKVLEVIPTGEQYGVIFNKENTALRDAVNQALADMKADGTLDKIINEQLG